MTTTSSPATPHLPGRRPRLAVARDLLVAALCALIVGGFLFGVDGGVGEARQPASATRLSS